MESHLARQAEIIEVMGCTTEIDLRRKQLILIPNAEGRRPKRVSLTEFQESGLSLRDFVLSLRQARRVRW